MIIAIPLHRSINTSQTVPVREEVKDWWVSSIEAMIRIKSVEAANQYLLKKIDEP